MIASLVVEATQLLLRMASHSLDKSPAASWSTPIADSVPLCECAALARSALLSQHMATLWLTWKLQAWQDAGAYVEALILQSWSTYTFAVGVSGAVTAGGTEASAGGAGASGTVEAFFS